MKTYQSVLPWQPQTAIAPTTPPPRPPPPRPPVDLAAKLFEGFWLCADCNRWCEREEGENGLPAHCHRCGSHRLTWQAPILQEASV